jgi:CO/xanthine dehydrogenase Mo-binding subunit
MGNVHGPHGAKGIGELPMDGPAPAILNAIEDALGVAFDSVPLMPENVFEALSKKLESELAAAGEGAR